MIEARGRARAEWKGTKLKGGNTNSRVELRVSEIKGRGRRTHWAEQVAHKLNEKQQEKEGESRDETEKEQTNRQLTNEKR